MTGIGDILRTSPRPMARAKRCQAHPGVDVKPWGAAAFRTTSGTTAWNRFKADATHFVSGVARWALPVGA